MLCVLTGILSSCKKNEVAERKRLTNNHNNSAFTVHPKYHVLGYGYDVTGRLANAESSTLPVLNIEKYVTEKFGLFRQNDDVNDYFDYSYGENVDSYSKKLTMKYTATVDLGLLKVVKLFKGEINASYAKKDSSSSKYVYATMRKMIRQRSMRISYSVEDLINNYLTDQFRSDLLTLSAANLIKRYGTHVLTDIELGARLDMNYEAQTNNTKREEAATAGVNITAWKVFTVKGDITTNDVNASSNFNQTLHYNTIGGDGTKGLIGELTLDNSSPKINIGNWQSSCTRDNAALINIGKDGLIPLEDLINDPAKKAEVKNYLIQYYLANEYKSTPDPVTVFYSARDNNHVYTINKNDYPYAQNGFADLGINFYAFTTQVTGSVPVHVFYHERGRNHTYTINRYDYPYEQNGYKYLGVSFYAYPSQVSGSSPVHVFYTNANGGDHVYTINRNDYPYAQHGFSYLGINFYAIKK
jgi:hypothetical protein